jgi:hypothetical protein
MQAQQLRGSDCWSSQLAPGSHVEDKRVSQQNGFVLKDTCQ